MPYSAAHSHEDETPSETSGLKRVSVPPPPPSHRPPHQRPPLDSLPPGSAELNAPGNPFEQMESGAPSERSSMVVPRGTTAARLPSTLPPPRHLRQSMAAALAPPASTAVGEGKGRYASAPPPPPLPRWIAPSDLSSDNDKRAQAEVQRLEHQYEDLRERLTHERDLVRVERRNNEELRHEIAVLRNEVAQLQRKAADSTPPPSEAPHSGARRPSYSSLAYSSRHPLRPDEAAERAHLEHTHKRELDALKASYGRALRAQRANFNREMERVRTEHATEAERLKVEAAQEVKDQREAFEEAALLMRAAHDEQVAELTAAQSPDLLALRENFENERMMLKRDYEKQLEAIRSRMKKAFDFALDDRHGTLMELKRENAELRARLAKG